MNKKTVLEVPQAAVGAIVIKDKKILLVRRNKEPDKGKWAIPGGSVKLGETLQEAVEREIREETGVVIKAKDPVYTFDFIGRDSNGDVQFHYVIVDLEADYISGEAQPADDALEVRWFNPEELDEVAATESTRKLLGKIRFFS